MVTALIDAKGRADALAATLGALVPGVVNGLVADAIILTGYADASVSAIADAVGAEVAVVAPGENRWFVGAGRARRDWMLCLEEGDLMVDGWIGGLERFVSSIDERPLGRLSRGGGPFARGLLDAMWGTARLRPGDVVHRRLLGEAGLRRRVRPVRIAARIERDAPPR